MMSTETRANTATLRFARVAPRKARMVVDMIRDRRVDEALDIERTMAEKLAALTHSQRVRRGWSSQLVAF